MLLQNFVTLEGGDGSGTSTQLALIRDRLENTRVRGARIPFHVTFEPTDGPIGTLVRAALRHDVVLEGQTVARLFAADRGEHLHANDGIVVRAGRGELVVCDRYVPSSLVYQGLECGEDLPSRLNADFPHPELILYFDIDPRVACERFADRPVKDIYERLDFQIKVRERYERILPAYAAAGSRLARIDASRSVEEVADQVWSAMATLPILRG
jgi:dTMP kinase